MGTASPVLPNTAWELTRRCTGRMFLLRPDREVVDAVLYCFGYCAERWKMQLHGLALMPNHYHDTLTDLLGQRVEFTTELHSLLARCIKHLRGTDGEVMEGTVWEASEQTGRVMMVSEEAFIKAYAYAMANPVAAGLAHNLGEWPGFVSRPRDMLERRAITVKRPAYLSEHYPKTATLRFSLPPCFEGRGTQIAEAIETRAATLQREARKEILAAGGRFKTRDEVMAVSPFDAPKSKKKRDVIKPALRAANRVLMRAAKRQLVAWRHAYRRAFEAFRAGQRDVEWPAGTWFYAKYAGVRVAPAGTWTVFGAG